VAVCALGMLTKSVMVTAPLMALAYDAVFLAGSVRRALEQRGRVYLGLASTWLIQAWLMAHQPGMREAIASKPGNTPLSYVSAQPGIILDYLRLAVWPSGQCLDYVRMPPASAREILLPATVILILLVATGWAMRRGYAAWGFLGVWFFGTLAPTSSVCPLPDLMVEHRMYLPLASVIAGAVCTGWLAIQRAVTSKRAQWLIASIVVVIIAVTSIAMTRRRNADYRNDWVMVSDVLAKRPKNPRAHAQRGKQLREAGRIIESINEFHSALQLDPRYPVALNSLGIALADLSLLPEAAHCYARAVEIDPYIPEALSNLGIELARVGRLSEAVSCFRQALRIQPYHAALHHNLAMALLSLGRQDEALRHEQQALRLAPDNALLAVSLASMFVKERRLSDADGILQRVLQRDPANPHARRLLMVIRSSLRAGPGDPP